MIAGASRHRPLRPLIVGLGLCLVLFCLYFVIREPHDAVTWEQKSQQDQNRQNKDRHKQTPHRPSSATLQSLSLTEKQCQAEFPGLTRSIDEIVAEGPFRLKNTGDMGALQGRIKNGKIFIINAQQRSDLSEQMVNSRTAAIHQLHRALITAPASEPLPDTYFSINFQDQPFGTSWGYSRAINPAFRSKDRDERNFLMPHFSFWAWKLPFIGSIGRAAAAIDRLEHELYPVFYHKIPRAVWRGTTWFNSVHSPRLRQNLVAVAKGQSWADVEALDWVGGGGTGGRVQSSAQNATNALAIEDFCRYRYVLHTEGVAYSGRFQFLQMCNSVTITPPIVWMQHTTHLVKPVFSSHLLGAATTKPNSAKEKESPRKEAHKFAHDVKSVGKKISRRSLSVSNTAKTSSGHKSWPVSYPAGEANIVFVAPDWSDLKDTVAWLEAHPEVAAGIARNQRDLFVGGGYFSPAAETCYWRALVRGWATVAKIDRKEWIGHEEVSYESFTLDNGN
ncbi:hypothetical protein SPBR_07049 [Sporothrix brasiliensis 5110]|uniref:Glycosyl transferase CAP10 domain-containing protein n=1 Tax=Sporothrix brasiliensis 5110 TaxID=1398154 RepID=A0A0C2IT29_9PEZI|nr:uncharacterized protein SPBR_07049 [Sporothrix brasiliensis 5110]KIH88132.1 hypothetical protein SPBR_07049 [Sporothrix brasiliensis 5110]